MEGELIATLTDSSAQKLEKILLRKLGRQISRDELEQAYNSLMQFAHAVIELENNTNQPLDNYD